MTKNEAIELAIEAIYKSSLQRWTIISEVNEIQRDLLSIKGTEAVSVLESLKDKEG